MLKQTKEDEENFISNDPDFLKALEDLEDLSDGSDFWKELRKTFIENQKLKEIFEIQYRRNMAGIGYEQSGEIDKAIIEYEKNVSENFNGGHPYWSLCVIYRKRKDYENEIRIIQKAIINLPKKYDRYKIRLEKALILKKKLTIP
jgi:tetratricopeptide (TPR) repeat protein